ncbi:unannotated protein [freshwater metagenome]|uniref:Unannotated protein n=1 Tax=freshwater metagenome TaxID=449393 RepID=A0A6J6SHB5_9ZZZZ
MGGASGDDQQVAGLGCRATAVAEGVTALDGVHVEHRRRHPQRAAVAQPQGGADARADGEVGVRRPQRAELVVGQVADPHGAGTRAVGQLGADDVGHQPGDLREVRALGEREVQRYALEPRTRAILQQAGHRPQLARLQAVALHRGQPLQHEAGVGPAIQQVGQVLGAADRVDDAVVQRRIDLERGTEGPPRGQHQQTSVEALRDLRQLVVGAHGEHVGHRRPGPDLRVLVQPLRLAGQPREPEAVAVALGDRHQTRVGGRDPEQVAAPAIAVDGQGQAHVSACSGRARRPCRGPG